MMMAWSKDGLVNDDGLVNSDGLVWWWFSQCRWMMVWPMVMAHNDGLSNDDGLADSDGDGLI